MYRMGIHKHAHYVAYKDIDVHCLTPWSFECTYLEEAPGVFGYYLCTESDHTTWEEATEAAKHHARDHRTEPLTEDVAEPIPDCPWPDNE